jgi:hypothetical protein
MYKILFISMNLSTYSCLRALIETPLSSHISAPSKFYARPVQSRFVSYHKFNIGILKHKPGIQLAKAMPTCKICNMLELSQPGTAAKRLKQTYYYYYYYLFVKR